MLIISSVLGRDSEYILAEATRVQTCPQNLGIAYGSGGRFGPLLNLVSTERAEFSTVWQNTD